MKQYRYPMELIENIKLGKKTATGYFKELYSEEELEKTYELKGQTVEVIDETGYVHCLIRIKDFFEVNVSNPPLSIAQRECFDSIEAWQTDCKEYWAEVCPNREWNDDTIMLMQDIELVLVGVCGFVCDECPAFSRNISSETERKQLSKKWLELFNYEIEHDKICCDGCYKIRIKGREMLHDNCEYKRCAENKHLEKCSQCGEYICGKLDEYFSDYEKLSQSAEISKEDYEKYFKAHVDARKINGKYNKVK